MENNYLQQTDVQPKVTSNVTKGLIISGLLIIISLIVHFTKSQDQAWAKWLGNIVLFGGIIGSCIVYSKELNGNVTYGNVFAHGFKVTAVVTIISILFTIIFVLLLPEIKTHALDVAREQMEAQGKMESADIERALELAGKLFYVFLIGGLLIAYMIIGLIASAIGAAVAKKNPNPSPFN
jgi:hypothetical protein